MIERVASIRRVTKVVKGGRIMSFSALVVVGDGKGKVGIGKGRSKETAAAISKATQKAYKNLVSVCLVNSTITFRTTSKFGASKVLLFPTKAGKGIVASDSVRTVLCAVGATDIGAKCFGSTNPINVVFATLKGLLNGNQRTRT